MAGIEALLGTDDKIPGRAPPCHLAMIQEECSGPHVVRFTASRRSSL